MTCQQAADRDAALITVRAAEQRVIDLARATYPELPADLAILLRDALEDLEDAQRQHRAFIHQAGADQT